MRKSPALVRLTVSAVVAIILLIGCGPAAPQAVLVPAAAPAAAAATGNETGETVLLIGDSQSEPAESWPRRALAAAGYAVHFCGRGGTGFVAENGSAGNYADALQEGDWKLPGEAPELIVIQGGGNDAAQGASNGQISRNADRLIDELQERYPEAELAMIGTLARGGDDGGGRRSEVDALLATVAADHGLPFVAVGDWLTRYGLARYLADAVHMNPAGNRVLGLLLEKRLRDLHLESGSAEAGA